MRETRARAAAMGLTNAEVARLAKLDPQTVGDFFAGRRWPRPKTLAKLEQVLDLAPGELAAAAEGLEVQAAASAPAGFTLILDLPDYISDARLTESQIDYMRSGAQMGALRAFAEIEESRARRRSLDVVSGLPVEEYLDDDAPSVAEGPTHPRV